MENLQRIIQLLLIGKLPEQPNPLMVNRDSKTNFNRGLMGMTNLRNQLAVMDRRRADEDLAEQRRALANANWQPR